MRTEYAAIHIEKLASIDHEVTGCETTSRCVLSQTVNVTTRTLAQLVRKVKEQYGADGNDKYVYLPEHGGYFEWNQHEDSDGNKLDQAAVKRHWQDGKTVYLCDYSVKVQKREVSEIDNSEYAAAGLQVD